MRHEARLQRKHELAVGRARHRNAEASSEDEDTELHGADLANAEQAAVAGQGAAIRIQDIIERLHAKQNLPRPVSPPPRLQQHIANPQEAGMIFSVHKIISKFLKVIVVYVYGQVEHIVLKRHQTTMKLLQ